MSVILDKDTHQPPLQFKLIIQHNPRGWRNEDPEPRVGGGGDRPRAEKKIVTSPILMAEVVIDVPKGTSDGSPGVQDVLESL